MNRRTPSRQRDSHPTATDVSFPAYPSSSPTPASTLPLTPDQIAAIDPGDIALPSDVEAADALGMQKEQLTAEIRDEERQRHPDAPMDDENPRE